MSRGIGLNSNLTNLTLIPGAISTHPAAVSMFAAVFAMIHEKGDGNRVKKLLLAKKCGHRKTPPHHY